MKIKLNPLQLKEKLNNYEVGDGEQGGGRGANWLN